MNHLFRSCHFLSGLEIQDGSLWKTLSKGSYGKMNENFFLETTNMIKTELYLNMDQWMVLTKSLTKAPMAKNLKSISVV